MAGQANIWANFRRFFIGSTSANSVGGNNPNVLYPFSVGNSLMLFPDMNEKAIAEGYHKNATIFSIVRDSAMKFGSIPRYVYNDNQTTSATAKNKFKVQKKLRTKQGNAPYAEQADPNNKAVQQLTNLLNRPNPNQGQDAFLGTTLSYYLITGEAFIWCNRGFTVDQSFQTYNPTTGEVVDDSALDKLPILEQYVLPSNFIALIPDPNDAWNVLGYLLQYGGYLVYLRKQDVVHWKNTSLRFDPVTRPQLRGLSPLVPGGAILQVNSAAAKAAAELFLQGNGARGLLTLNNGSPDAIAPGQMDQVRQTLDKKVNNNSVAGAVAAMVGDWKYVDLNKPFTMPLIDGARYSDQQLCMLFGMPYEMLQPGTTFSNKEMALKNWINNTIIPLCRQLDNEMNRILLPAFGLQGKVCIGSDPSNLNELQDDALEQAQAQALMPYLTFNEKRIQFGLDPLEDAIYDQPWIQTGLLPASAVIDDINSMNQPPIDPFNSDESGNSADDEKV